MAAVMTQESVVVKPLSLLEIRAKIEKARDRKYYRRSEDVKKEIEDLKETLDLSKRREKSCVEQTSSYKTEKTDYEAALKEATEYKEYLVAGGEDADKIIKDISAKVAELDTKLHGQQEKLLEVQREIADTGRRIGALETELDKIEAAQKADETRKPEERNEYISPDTAKSPFYYKATYRKILGQLPSYRQEVQELFREVELLPKKLDCFNHDQNAKTLFMMSLGAIAKMLMIERCHELNDEELEATRQILNAMRTMSRMYSAGVIESLSGGDKPRQFLSWREYGNDAKRQAQNYFDPKKVEERQKFGVITPAPIPAAPAATLAPFRIVMPVRPIVRAPIPAPAKSEEPEIKESLDKRIIRTVKESGAIKKTTGLRVAIIAGQADKNKPLIQLLEDAFEFKKLRWYDNNCGHLVDSIKIGGVNLLIAIPEWHEGYMQYVRFAKDKGISTIIMNGHNKKLMVQQICAHFGAQVSIPD